MPGSGWRREVGEWRGCDDMYCDGVEEDFSLSSVRRVFGTILAR